MENAYSLREKANQMAQIALAMLKSTFDGFMKHDPDILAGVLENEQKLNDMEKVVTMSLVGMNKAKVSAAEKKNIMRIANIVTDLEQIGDYIKDMVERIEIKIEEKLLFSEDALDDYKHLYNSVEGQLQDIDKALTLGDKGFAKRVLCDESHVDKLVRKYRDAHAKRLMAGGCEPRACNMFMNLLDFTAQISHHAKAVARNTLLLK